MIFQKIREDFITHNKKFEWGFWAMVVYRFGQWRYNVKPGIVRKPLSLLYKLFFHYMKGKGIEFPCEIKIGKNFRIDHQGGIVVSGWSEFGDNCVIRNGVTIGIARAGDTKAPKIGNNVDIGAGAKILGDIIVGDNVLIGANSVVIQNIPSDCTVVGIPGRVIKRNKN